MRIVQNSIAINIANSLNFVMLPFLITPAQRPDL